MRNGHGRKPIRQVTCHRRSKWTTVGLRSPHALLKAMEADIGTSRQLIVATGTGRRTIHLTQGWKAFFLCQQTERWLSLFKTTQAFKDDVNRTASCPWKETLDSLNTMLRGFYQNTRSETIGDCIRTQHSQEINTLLLIVTKSMRYKKNFVITPFRL